MLWHRLVPLYEPEEAKAVVRMVLEERFGLSLADVVAGGLSTLPEADAERLETLMVRLEAGEPVQYVLGECTFCGRCFRVGPEVLIPRPETEELCRLIVARERALATETTSKILSFLDVGTGSGCIAITLKAELQALPSVMTLEAEAWDVSEAALLTARKNADRNHVQVTFRQQDALQAVAEDSQRWDFIVSNPPYVCQNERATMAPNVLNHEPHEALFVPDDDPLLFYRAIARYASASLKDGGRLYFEINPNHADALVLLLKGEGFLQTELLDDTFGKKRFISTMKMKNEK